MSRAIRILPPGFPPSSQPIVPTFRSRPLHGHALLCQWRHISTNGTLREQDTSEQAKKLDQKGANVQDGRLDEAMKDAKDLQTRTPWHREGSDKPPVKRNRSAGAMTKGKLLTTPSRLLKLVLPITTKDMNTDRKDIEPLALLVHPQQPLSYLERLIQSELPLIKSKDGKTDKIPEVHFRAEDMAMDEDQTTPAEQRREKKDTKEEGTGETREIQEEGSDAQMLDGEQVKAGKISASQAEANARPLRGGPGKGGVESYSPHGREGEASDKPKEFVRWSSSTEVGDFIRDAARGKEFAISIEGSSAANQEVLVGVPSFNDRTYYLRTRLRRTTSHLADYVKLKNECDHLAHKSAQRLGMGGFGALVAWWAAIYHFTFQTDYGWDTMEPITYLFSLTFIMMGHVWFLYHNREVSYQSALKLTVSRRQKVLYDKKGFDVQKWEAMLEEANSLRKQIKYVAEEYDVEWDERKDERNSEVAEAMRRGRDRKKGKKDEEEDEEGERGQKDSAREKKR